MISRLLDWLDQRVGARKLISEALDEPIPGGASLSYVFGSGALILFLVQLGTGVLLATYYSPSTNNAWASVAYLEREIAAGALVRGVHHHAAGAMVLVVVAHMLQVVWFGAYKAPREVNWWSGLGLLGLVLAFALTGYLLPWDQTGYWATRVATSIMGTLPVIGPWLQRIAQGGNDYGHLTLTRFYTLHVVVLPLLCLGLLGAHVSLFRRHGVTPSARRSEAELRQTETFWPRQVAYDAVFAVLVISLVLFLAVRKGAPLEAPADPSSLFVARPEWYFLFLFQLLKYFEGPLEVIGTVVIPGAAGLFLLLLPMFDRGAERRIRERIPWVGAVFGGFFGILVLTGMAVMEDRGDPTLKSQKLRAERDANRAKELAKAGVPPAGAAEMLARDPLTRGERLFAQECASCHPLEGESPEEPEGPDLTGYGSSAWIRQVLLDPDSPRLFGRTKVSGMKSFSHLKGEELDLLVNLVVGLRKQDTRSIEARPGAELLDTHECSNCHDFEEEYGLEGPTLFRYQSPEWIAGVIADPGADHYYGEANDMPAFESRLSEEDRDALVVFLLSLAERADQGRWPFVNDP